MSGGQGLVVVCDTEGSVVQIKSDHLDDDIGLHVGDDLRTVLDTGSWEKFDRFLRALAESEAETGWEMHVRTSDGSRREMYFGGGHLGDRLLIVAAASSDGMMDLYRGMMEISNQQTNEIRALQKSISEFSDSDEGALTELTRVNNELSNLQRELARKNSQLERLNEQKNEFLGMAAHDLRNPLGVISMSAEYLAERAELDEKGSELLRMIRSSARFLHSLVDDLLDVSQIEAGKLEMDVDERDLREIFEDDLRLLGATAERKDISIEVEEPDEPLVARVDPDRIRQGFHNLLSNAVKYSPPGAEVFVRMQRRDGELRVSIEDHGPGIPDDEIEHLFEPFSMVSTEPTAGEKSTGLGLLISKRVVEAHGGRIEVQSTVGEGSTFTIVLPGEAE